MKACIRILVGAAIVAGVASSGSAYVQPLPHSPSDSATLQFDEQVVLGYHRARMLHPDAGRFLQRDPLGYVDGLNLHQYVRSSPPSRLDPYGSDDQSGEVDAKLTWTLDGNLANVALDANYQSKTLQLGGTANLRARFKGTGFLAHFKLSNYDFESFDVDFEAKMNKLIVPGASLTGRLDIDGELDADLTGVLDLRGDVRVNPDPWFIPNARVKRFIGSVTAEIGDDEKMRCVVKLRGSGNPEFFLLRVLVPRVSVRGYAQSDGCCKSLGPAKIVGLMKDAATNIRATAHVLGVFPMRLR